MAKEKPTLILVVEDHSMFREGLANIIKNDLKCDVITAPSGEQAMQEIRLNKPDLVLTDLSLLNMDGLELNRQLKHDKETKDLPVILLTAYGSPEIVASAFAEGVYDFLPKTGSKARLLKSIKKALRAKRLGL